MAEMAKKGAKDGRYEWVYELSLDNLPTDMVENILSGNIFFDPVFDAVATLQDYDWFSDHLMYEDRDRAAVIGEHMDSTVTNHYWEMAEFYSSQFVIGKRERDRRDYRWNRAVKERRTPRDKVPTCSALTPERARCTREAKYVYARKTANKWSYQRRCDLCFVKVKDKTKYRPIKDGRYFKAN